MRIIRSKEYYNQLWPVIEAEQRTMNYHAAQAEHYKRIYILTKDRKGVWSLLNRLAFKMNQKHYKAGMKLGEQQMMVFLNEMIALDKISKGEEV